VLVTWVAYPLEGAEFGGALRDGGLELRYSPRDYDRSADEMAALAHDAVAVVADADRFDESVLARTPRLRVIARTGVGLDSIDLDAATDHGVAVTITPGANHDAVADHTLALMLAILRRLGENDARVRAGGWRTPDLFAWQLTGLTVGLVGVGLIGTAVAQRLAGFGVRLLAHDPYAPPGEPAEAVSLEQLLAESDVVSIHCPLSPETQGLLNAERIRRMKPSAIVVNTARGPIVEEDALVDALASGRLRGAGLDVFVEEPPPSERLRSLPNVVLSPHHGGLSDVSNAEMCRRATRAVLAVLNGEIPEGLVNEAALARPRAGA